ncbi:hypothetical protein HanPSC8_Chr11g0482791 [Helianthus annuus]|nr:hypothetical protein HanPSC8_Chr11g0482791 [Helianthus annuus]
MGLMVWRQWWVTVGLMVLDWGLLFGRWGGLLDSGGLFYFYRWPIESGPDGSRWCRWCPVVPMVPCGADGARIGG